MTLDQSNNEINNNLDNLTQPTVCYRHPKTETGLRCNKCNRYICAKCAKRTPVGYTCPDCIRQQEDKYFSGTMSDYLIAAVIAFPLSLVAAILFFLVVAALPFSWLIAFFAAPATAGVIAEVVRWGVQKRRSRYLPHVVAGCLILATSPSIIFPLIVGQVWVAIVPAILLFMGTGTIMARLR